MTVTGHTDKSICEVCVEHAQSNFLSTKTVTAALSFPVLLPCPIFLPSVVICLAFFLKVNT